MKRIALLGECMIELNGKPFGDMQQAFGDTLNTAIYLARASQRTDIQVHYLTAMGQDPLSQQIIARWQQAGIDTSAVLIDEQRHPGLYLIQLDEQGERTFLYWRNDSAARYLMQHPQLPRLRQAISGVDAIYLSGISLAILPTADRQALLQWLGELHRAGVEIILTAIIVPPCGRVLLTPGHVISNCWPSPRWPWSPMTMSRPCGEIRMWRRPCNGSRLPGCSRP